MKEKLLLAVIFLSGFVLDISAQSRSLPFLEFNPDVRTAGMGDAFPGQSGSMYIYANPTAFPKGSRRTYFSCSFGRYPEFEGESKYYQALSAGFGFGKQALMFGFRRMNDYSFRLIGEDMVEREKVRPVDKAFDLVFARRFGEGRFSAFIGGSFIYSSKGETARTGGVNGGLYYKGVLTLERKKGGYVFGLGFRNMGGKIKYGEGEKNPMPGSIVFGTSANLPFSRIHRLDLAFSMDCFVFPSNAPEFTLGMGAEYRIFEICALRAGYHYGKNLDYFTLGTGITYKSVGMDLAYQIADSESNVNTVRIGFHFGF